MKVENEEILCRRIIFCGKDFYSNDVYVVLFMHKDEELIWKTTSKSKLFSDLREGKTYKLSWHQDGDMMGYVKS